MKHELKCWPEYFHALVLGAKPFEVRKNDRDFKRGDTLVIQEFFPCEDCEGKGQVPDTVWREDKTGMQMEPHATWKDCKVCKGKKGTYSGQQVAVVVTFVLSQFTGLAEGYVALGLRPALTQQMDAEAVVREGESIPAATRAIMAAGLFRISQWISCGGQWVNGGGTLTAPEKGLLHLKVDLTIAEPPVLAPKPRIQLV